MDTRMINDRPNPLHFYAPSFCKASKTDKGNKLLWALLFEGHLCQQFRYNKDKFYVYKNNGNTRE